MKVHVEGNIYIESDGMQFILKEYTGGSDKKGNKLFRSHGYFSTVEQALQKVVKLKVMRSNAATLNELLKEVREIREFIETIVTT